MICKFRFSDNIKIEKDKIIIPAILQYLREPGIFEDIFITDRKIIKRIKKAIKIRSYMRVKYNPNGLVQFELAIPVYLHKEEIKKIIYDEISLNCKNISLIIREMNDRESEYQNDEEVIKEKIEYLKDYLRNY